MVSVAYVSACGAYTAGCADYSGICNTGICAMLGPAPTQVAVALVQTALATTMQYQCLHATLAVATIAAVLPNAPACLAQCPALPATLAPHAHVIRI